MSGMKRRELTTEEQAEAQRLANAWEEFRVNNRGTTQTWLGAETGLGNQSAVSQYLRGVIPLNLTALLAFCKVLGVDAKRISPRLAGVLSGAASVQSAPHSGSGLTVASTAREQLLLMAYRGGSDNDRSAMDAMAEQMLLRASAGGRDQGR